MILHAADPSRVTDLYLHHPFPHTAVGAPVFTLHRDEEAGEYVTVDRWHRLIAIAYPFLEDRREDYVLVSPDWSVVTLTPDNGVAFYRREADYPHRELSLYRLVWGELY